MNKRVDWIDYAKGIGIVCVMLLHAQVDDPYRRVIYLWVIPLFFLLSGIHAHREQYSTYKDFFRHKSLRLLMPYAILNGITYLFWLFIGRHFGTDAGAAIAWWEPLVGIVRGEYPYIVHNEPLWFIAALFSTETVYYLLYRPIRRASTYLAVTLGLLVVGWLISLFGLSPLPWEIATVPAMLPFYAAGAWMGEEVRSGRSAMPSTKQILGLLVLGLAAMVVGYLLNIDEVRVSANRYGAYLPFLSGAVGGCMVVCGASMLLERGSKYMTWLAFIGRNTLWILGLHLMAYSLVKGVAVYILHLPLEVFASAAGKGCLVVCGLLVLLPVCIGIQRMKR